VAGEYIVWVSVCADELLITPLGICGDGASNYQLSVGQAIQESESTSLRLSSDFVTGEALVRFNTQPASETESGFAGQSITASAVEEASKKIGNVHLLQFEQEFAVQVTASALSDGAAGDTGANQHTGQTG
jgi:hypothetical protein